MTKEELIEDIDFFINYAEGQETWFSKDLVEQSLILLEEIKNFLKNN